MDFEATIAALDRGEVRVAEKVDGEWRVNEEAKAAILEYFRVRKVEPIEVGPFEYLDKIPLKRDHAERGVRVVPPATARYGSFLSPGVILMPSYVNIGAWVGPNTMVDTWATVGSCAQIGADVHLAGGTTRTPSASQSCLSGILSRYSNGPTSIGSSCRIRK